TPRAEAYREVLPAYPAPGLVEHDPEALWRATLAVLGAVLARVPAEWVRGLGVATQRGTALVWDAATGRAAAPALSWQDGRTAAPGLPPLPLAALVGDQQAAMMGQLRLAPGEVKITYGTSAMLDLNAGAEPLWSTRGAYPLVLWQRGGVPTFCLEGTAITAGAAITWLRDALGVI